MFCFCNVFKYDFDKECISKRKTYWWYIEISHPVLCSLSWYCQLICSFKSYIITLMLHCLAHLNWMKSCKYNKRLFNDYASGILIMWLKIFAGIGRMKKVYRYYKVLMGLSRLEVIMLQFENHPNPVIIW